MMRPGSRTEKVLLYPYPVDFRKPVNGLAALVALEIKVANMVAVAFACSYGVTA